MIDVPISYELLRVIWWALLGALLIGFAIMDGFDMGVGTLLPFVAKTNTERRVMINSIAPVWEGNQVWFILGGGAIFAAWPLVYATAFSGFYVALFLVLLALILRPVGFDFRSKVDDPRWRKVWDTCLFIGGFVPSLVFGVAFGNLMLGVPFYFDETMNPHYTGTFLQLLNPYGLLCGLISLLMLTMHGGVYLNLKTEGVVAKRARKAVYMCASVFIVLFVIAGIWSSFYMDGYVITYFGGTEAASNPMAKTVALAQGGWFENFRDWPLALAVPISVPVFALITMALIRGGQEGKAFITSALSVAMTVATAGVAMFPFLMPSSVNPAHSLTVWDGSSSHATLFYMLAATIIFLPVVLVYTSWVFAVLKGKVTNAYIKENSDNLY